MKILKKLFTLSAVCLISVAAFALPGVRRSIEDFSGEYVYYRDNTFQRPSYIGFIYYNDSTYAARYFAPGDKRKQLSEADITIYLTTDSSADHFEFTGETISGASSSEDTEIINYLHDLLYELDAKRKTTKLYSSAVTEKEDYPQFGGTVSMTYNPFVPVFNLESIRSADGSYLFRLETVGALTSSADMSFEAYKGVEGLPADRKRSFKKAKASAAKVSFGRQSLTLDSQWKNDSLENMWFLGDYAVLALSEIPPSEDSNFEYLLVRKLFQSTEGAYSLWQSRSFTKTVNLMKVSNVFYQPVSGDVTRDFKIITKQSDGSYAYLTLTVFDGVYQDNKAYFTKILDSYKVN